MEPLRRFLVGLVRRGQDRYQDSKLDYNAAAAAALYGMAFLMEADSRGGPARYGTWLWVAAGIAFIAGGIAWAAYQYAKGERRRRTPPSS